MFITSQFLLFLALFIITGHASPQDWTDQLIGTEGLSGRADAALTRGCGNGMGCPSYCGDKDKCLYYGCLYDRLDESCSTRNSCENNNEDIVFSVNLCGEATTDSAGIWYQKDDPSQFHPEKDYCYERQDRVFQFERSLYVNQYHPSGSTGVLYIPIWEDGHYQLNMKFVELFKPIEVHRIFSLTLNNLPLVSELDAYLWKADFHQEVHNFYIKDMQISVKESPFTPFRGNQLAIRFLFHADKVTAAGGEFTNNGLMSALYVRRIGDAPILL